MITDIPLEVLEQRFPATFENAAVGIAHIELNGRFSLVNEKLCSILGYAQKELIQLRFQDVTCPLDLPRDLQSLRLLYLGEIENFSIEKRYIRKDGSLVWTRITVSLFRNPMPKYYICFVEDISARQVVEIELQRLHTELEERVQKRTQELYESNQSLKREIEERENVQSERDSFVDLSMDPMFIVDFDGNFRRVNPALCQMLDYTQDELLNRNSIHFVHPEDRHGHVEARQLAKVEPKLKCTDTRYLARDGSIRWMSWTAKAVHKLRCFYVTGRDVTDLKLRQEIDARNHALLANSSKLHAVGLMAANMAHEINNPLTIILGEGCMLKDMLEAGKTDLKKLNRIADNVVLMSERIVKIVNGLRTMARDGSSDPLDVVPVQHIFDNTIPFCRARIHSESICLEIQEPAPEIQVKGRAVQISQVLLNLINNAYDASLTTPETMGKIEIFTCESEDRVQIRVRDNGPGIDPKIAEHLFHPFVTSKPAGLGLGLGLNVSKNMIESQNGELYLDASAAQTTFVISLPRG